MHRERDHAVDSVHNAADDAKGGLGSRTSQNYNSRQPNKNVSFNPAPSALSRENPDQLSNQEERAELALVLSSEMFRRSPKLSRLLSYLCDKYFVGEGGELKEYSIAVDVLGRDTEFDPQLDAVVRVDTHHLRKRLKQYYSSDGANHKVQIVIPNGQYTPMFVQCAELTPQAVSDASPTALGDETMALPVDALNEKEALQSAIKKSRSLIGWGRWQIFGLLLVLAVVVALVSTNVGRSKSQLASVKDTNQIGKSGVASSPTEGTAAATVSTALIAVPEFRGVRILAGDRSGNYADRAGRLWLSDRYFTGGTTFHRGPREIERTSDPEIFRSGREGQFAYEIPLSPGTYELHLYFAETGVESEALRSVSLAINGLPVSTLDVASDAGGVNTATVKIFKDISPAKDGLLHLTFQGSGPSFVNALEVLPGTPGKMLPIRLITRDSAYRDHQGQIWMPDQYFLGGRHSSRSSPIEGTADTDLYVTQRYGHFTYSIPVAEGGRYRVTLHFVETWFNPNSLGGIGSRVFDVYCNGSTLLKDFDILKETGGIGNRPIVKTFHNIQASPQGKIDLTFVPISNYALLTALEVSQE